mgnify:CR=1 FL=1
MTKRAKNLLVIFVVLVLAWLYVSKDSYQQEQVALQDTTTTAPTVNIPVKKPTPTATRVLPRVRGEQTTTGVSNPQAIPVLAVPPAPQSVIISLGDNGFNSPMVTVKSGQIVEWINKSGGTMWIVSNEYPGLDSGVVGPLSSFKFVVLGSGKTYTYYNKLTPLQNGKISVE